MKIFVGNKWRGGFLDYYKSPAEYRIKTLGWKNLEKLEGAYFVRPKSIRLVLNYIHKIGVIAVLRKIISRLREKYRNEKYVSCGFGVILEPADKNKFSKGEIVGFIAPFHPAALERIVLPEDLIIKMPQSDIPSTPSGAIAYQPLENEPGDLWWRDIRGWSIYSGAAIPENTRQNITENLKRTIKNTDWSKSKKLIVKDGEIAETKIVEEKQLSGNRKTGVLFGYGNYAKSVALPNIKSCVNVITVHEIDPTQIFFEKKYYLDTSPSPRENERYDVYLIAGYHHTHAPLAIYALKQNAAAVVEKPVVTEEKQLNELLSALKTTEGKLFSAFHKRYSPFNPLIFKDLNANLGEPISYRCTVYETLQPPLYWYRWPNSKSELLSNGCHWIDHFLYLNNFSEPKNYGVEPLANGAVNAAMTLENGASFSMTFAKGKENQIGIQDNVELRAKNAAVKIINDAEYAAENEGKIVRKEKINKMKNYKIMYNSIGKKILSGGQGDSLQSVEISSNAVLKLESIYKNLHV